MKKIVPDPPVPATQSSPSPPPLNVEEQLSQAWDLLRCASATAFECGDGLHGQPRDLAMATSHLIGLAQSVIGQLIDQWPGARL
ncbi:DUF3077 domain-containing protein [uncultured Pseudomonas sp.]|uniref:DUF6124 family protein n=1 Tax=uncultured Pseudomonas sp. TaxID=114707 RepID=UPI0025CBD842|nr:DUF3077 domain-containing protein [uncultured Pseudomonas sp.]